MTMDGSAWRWSSRIHVFALSNEACPENIRQRLASNGLTYLLRDIVHNHCTVCVAIVHGCLPHRDIIKYQLGVLVSRIRGMRRLTSD